MDAEIERLVRKVLADLKSKDPGSRIIIGISGVPGSGKTTLAAAVASRLNAIHAQESPLDSSSGKGGFAVAVPMDGFHFSRRHLASMPNPEEAIHRRGAAFTFDGEGFLDLIRALYVNIGATVYAPSFSHEIKDPVPNSIAISPGSRIVLVEGNYCALNRAPWKDAAKLLTGLWFIDTPAHIAHERLAKRHLQSGIVADEKEAWDRARGTDELNAKDIRDNRLPVDEVISFI